MTNEHAKQCNFHESLFVIEDWVMHFLISTHRRTLHLTDSEDYRGQQMDKHEVA